MVYNVRLSLTLLVTCLCARWVVAVDHDADASRVFQARTANTWLDRSKLFGDDDAVFDFTKQDYYTFSPGGVINANAATFPFTAGNGMTMAMLNLGPCAMLPAHFHPRAANYVVAVQGQTETYMFQENGAPTIHATLTPGKMTVFPQASIHLMQNMGCENAQLVSALNSDDTGTLNVANTLFQGIPADLVSAILGGAPVDINSTAGYVPAIGTGAIMGSAECQARCGLNVTKRSTDFRA
ncbi:RmlC-like cupin [Saccharata proteae CBS 121410]|uniref:RmlC-like cupin n=1 Tax=Saccharata proteae CBS 121410 TaxID=1314787 RepID=A0A9P4HXW6_9PEZI|nr:RmlC-like cupin [Saccharata proteae CBS 121410]